MSPAEGVLDPAWRLAAEWAQSVGGPGPPEAGGQGCGPSEGTA